MAGTVEVYQGNSFVCKGWIRRNTPPSRQQIRGSDIGGGSFSLGGKVLPGKIIFETSGRLSDSGFYSIKIDGNSKFFRFEISDVSASGSSSEIIVSGFYY